MAGDYKVKIQEIAEMMADDDGKDYFELSNKDQMDYYKKAYEYYLDRDLNAMGGIMRAKYARGSEEDIPEVEDMPIEEFEDIKKMLGAPTEQASGIRSINKKMASAPSLEDSINDISMMLFGKPMDQLDELEEEQLRDYLDDQAKRRTKSIKMAEYDSRKYDPLIVDEYEKYKFDAEEQGQPVMSIDEFLQMARSQAADGGSMKSVKGGVASLLGY